MMGIPASVIVVTKNEEARIGACLEALSAFDDLWVVDSGSSDRTAEMSIVAGARLVDFQWNGQYPKKRQWCLDTLDLKYDWVFFIDADEIATPEVVAEIAALELRSGEDAPGYFVRGRYIFEGRLLRYGLSNNKLCLIDRTRMMFPVVDDLDLPGMGEIEGHYQPVIKEQGVKTLRSQHSRKLQSQSQHISTAQPTLAKSTQAQQRPHYPCLKHYILHNAFEMAEGFNGALGDQVGGAQAKRVENNCWQEHHERYAAWERGMNARGAWPDDPRMVKRAFKALPSGIQGFVAFIHSYILKRGFLDGAPGFRFALSRWRYYRMI